MIEATTEMNNIYEFSVASIFAREAYIFYLFSADFMKTLE